MDYGELDRLVAQLERMVEEANPRKGYWGELWSLTREIGAGFKGALYPTRDDKDRAWHHYQAVVEKARARSEESKKQLERNEREWKQKQFKSESLRNGIQAQAASSRPLTDFERGLGELFFFPFRMVETILAQLLGLKTQSELDEIRQELLSCNKVLQEAWKTFHERRGELLPGDRSQAYESLQKARQRLDEAWEQWKAKKSALHDQRQREWAERQRLKEEQREERARKHRLFVSRVQAHIEELQGKLATAESALTHQQSHLSDLRSQYYSAWSDSFKERCSGWIDECETRISSIREHIDRLEGWIREERDKLS